MYIQLIDEYQSDFQSNFSLLFDFYDISDAFALEKNKKTSRQKNFPIKRENRHLINQTKMR